MTDKRKSRQRTSNNASRSRPTAPEVGVVGGGLSGMTAALKLLQAGYQVTLFERHDRLGGNTSSIEVNGVEHDVYPHMFCDWYSNFWHLFEQDLGLKRADHFVAHAGSMMLAPGATEYITLLNPTSLEAAVANLGSGAMSPAELVLLGYSGIDLAAQEFASDGLSQMQRLDVNGFLYSRGYATEAVAEMQNYLLTLVWSSGSDRTSARTYGNFLQHSLRFPDHSPFDWLLKNSLNDGLVAPLRAKLEALGCTIRTGALVESVRLDHDQRPIVRWRARGAKRITAKTFDFGVLAVPPDALAELALSPAEGLKGTRMVDAEPALANLRRLAGCAIPVLDLYLKEKLPDLPRDTIGLAGSAYGLSVLDISQLWPDDLFGGKTALVIAASDAAAIPADDLHDMALLILADLARYYPQFAGITGWGDPRSPVDWEKTNIRSNARHKLFLEETGSWRWRPVASYPATLPRLAIAGDLCRTDVEMATIESAVQSGVQAAVAIQTQDASLGNHPPRGKLIAAQPHTVYSPLTFRAAKLLYLPAAYAAYAWVALENYRSATAGGDDCTDDALATLIEDLALVPSKMATEAGEGAYWFFRSLIDKDDENPGDETIGLGAAALMVLGEIVNFAASRLSESGGTTSRDDEASGKDPRRRWRVKH